MHLGSSQRFLFGIHSRLERFFGCCYFFSPSLFPSVFLFRALFLSSTLCLLNLFVLLRFCCLLLFFCFFVLVRLFFNTQITTKILNLCFQLKIFFHPTCSHSAHFFMFHLSWLPIRFFTPLL